MFTYSELRDIQKKELETSGLVQLPDNFYEEVVALLAQKKQDALRSQSILVVREFENTRKILLSIHSKREEKLVLLAVRGENSNAGLTSQEKELLKELSSIIIKSRQQMSLYLDGESSIPADSLRLKLVQAIAQYKGIDNVVYGPFKPGDQTVLPRSEAEWLLKAKLAEIM